MKKILFLSFSYPYGHFGPSDNCTVRVMEALARTGRYDVWNLSYSPKSDSSKPNYKLVEGVRLLYLPFPEKHSHHSYAIEHLLLFLKIPIYPFFSLRSIRKHFNACKEILKDNDFDLVVSQCSPQDSVMVATLLKRKDIIRKQLVLFWDNIYGKIPRKVIPEWYALSRSRKVENWIARFSDKMVSPIPVKNFHDQYGDVDEAKGKRLYIGHPLINRPNITDKKNANNYIKSGFVNLIYAGRLYRIEDILYAIKLLNVTSFAERTNLIFFFYQLPSEEEMNRMKSTFKGSICFSGRVAYDELLSIYSKADAFLSFAGGSSAQVISKIYDYMCFGKPVVYFFRHDGDVNVEEFHKYPSFLSVDVRRVILDYTDIGDRIISMMSRDIPYEEVERLFYNATGTAYVRVIDALMNENLIDSNEVIKI